MVLDRTPHSVQTVNLDDSGSEVGFEKTVAGPVEQEGETFGLPEPWERRRDPDGNIFYFNARSHLSQWRPPPGMYELKLLEDSTVTYTLGLIRAPKPPPALAATVDKDSELAKGKFQRATLNQNNTSSLKSLVGYAYQSLFARKEGKDQRAKLLHTYNSKKAAAKRRRIAALEREAIEPEQEEEPVVWGYVKVVVSEGFGIDPKGAKKATCRITLRKPDRTKVDSFETKVDLKKDDWKVKAEFVCHDPLSTVVISLAATVNKMVQPIGKVELQVRETLDQWRDLTSQEDGEAGMILVLLMHELAAQAKRTVADNALPAGWESKATPDGRIFYVDNFHRSTQWAHPASKLPEPKDWIKRTDAEGRIEYVELQPKKQFSKDFVPRVRYTNPNEAVDVQIARENTVGVLNGLTDLLDVEHVLGDRDAIQDRTDWQYAKAQEKEHREMVDWESLEGRLASFNREAHGCELTVWPHGKHKLRDRQAMYDEMVGIARLSRKNVPRTLRPDLPLSTDIPVVEGHFYKRKGKVPSMYWEEFYCELRVHAENQQHVQLVWGEMDPWGVHQTGRVIEARGGVLRADVARVSFCARGAADAAAINLQYAHRDMVNMYGFDIEMRDGAVYNFAGESLDDCKAVVAILGSLPLDTERVPPYVPHSPKAMATAGLFFAPTAQFGDRVECGLCGVHLSQWKLGDEPLARHKALSPRCPFFAEGHQDKPPKMMLADLHRPEALIHKVIIDEPEEEAGAPEVSPERTQSGSQRGKSGKQHKSLVDLLDEGFFKKQADSAEVPMVMSHTEAAAAGEQLRKQRQRLQRLAYGGPRGKELLDLCVANDVGGVRRLLVLGVPVNAADGGLRTPLHWAAAMGNDQITSLLIAHGADVEAKTVNGFTPLMLARNADTLRASKTKAHCPIDEGGSDEWWTPKQVSKRSSDIFTSQARRADSD